MIDAPTAVPSVAQTRRDLAAAWRAVDPHGPEEIARFYQEASGLGPDLDAWHATPERREWTHMLVHVARAGGAGTILDIGCGAGHDLLALRAALPDARLGAVEPNAALASAVGDRLAIPVYRSVTDTPVAALGSVPVGVEDADLLICIDVLEHVPDPEAFLGGIAQRARIGCLLFETTATHDTGTPLHLAANRGWQPGRCLERHGWRVVDQTGRVRVWRRVARAGQQRASVLLCAYRSIATETTSALLAMSADGQRTGWRVRIKAGDALIARSRAILASAWWRETADDVLLMVDDDVVFTPADADRVVELCRGGLDIVCGAYPTHNGAHLACRFLPGVRQAAFGPGQAPLEIAYAATGFMAVHRRVLDALIPALPLCHADQPWSFWPLFQSSAIETAPGAWEWLSEDWGFCHAARGAGFRVWLDPQTLLTHLGHAGVSVRNMAALHAALQEV